MFVITIIFLCSATLAYLATLVWLTNGLKEITKQDQTADLPGVSVIVCAHNEAHHLPKCLEHLKAQNYPAGKLEFILVDDRSDDGTAALMEEVSRQDPRFRMLQITDRIPDFAPKKRAIDLGINNSKNEIILLTDADGHPGVNWAKTMMSYFTADVDMVLGYAPYSVKPASHFIKKILALEYLSHAAIAAASTGHRFPVTCVGTNMAYRKKLYLQIGGFGKYKNQISGDDDLFLTHVRAHKRYRFAYATNAESHVYNNPPRLWSKFLHQRMRYASKGFKYPLKVTLSLIIYFLYNLGLVGISFSLLSLNNFYYVTLSLIGLKWLGEFLFIRRAAKTLHDQRHLKEFPLAALFHIPYVVIFAILGQFNFFKWAETTAETGTQKKRI